MDDDAPATGRPCEVPSSFSIMSQESTARRCPVRCVNCGEILAATVEGDGTIVPIGVENDGTCGDAEFRVLQGRGSAATDDTRAASGNPGRVSNDADAAANEQ